METNEAALNKKMNSRIEEENLLARKRGELCWLCALWTVLAPGVQHID